MSLLSKKAALEQRQIILRAVRDYLFQAGYLEVQVPLLIRGTNPDAFLTSFEVTENDQLRGYLTTSTEFQILRLLAAGYDKVYTIASNFRAGDKDQTHNPEFTMLEWEAANVGMEVIEKEAEGIVLAAVGALKDVSPSHLGRGVRGEGAFERLSVREAFKKYLGINIALDFSLASMVEEIKKAGLDAPQNFLDDQGILFSWLIDKISPKLGFEKPTWLYEWPIFQTSMAEPVKGNPEAADRSELYINGLEIANGFTTVSDAEKQKALFDFQQAERQRLGKKPIVVDEKYLEDIKKMPPAAGMAMGIDRLVMILTGASEINEVLTFGSDEL
ncbi:MAG: amino acid--tRNA ligase-related protein [Patescibacteria group bacterium]|jgi:lysyl-tRNA synthetase class 2